VSAHDPHAADAPPVLDIGAALDLLTAGRPVAETLDAAGLERVELDALRRGCVIRPDGRRGKVPIRLTLGALAVLDAAQRAEGSGLARDDVLAYATTVASRYLDLLPDSVFAAALSAVARD
jgi:hypothetical protein